MQDNTSQLFGNAFNAGMNLSFNMRQLNEKKREFDIQTQMAKERDNFSNFIQLSQLDLNEKTFDLNERRAMSEMALRDQQIENAKFKLGIETKKLSDDQRRKDGLDGLNYVLSGVQDPEKVLETAQRFVAENNYYDVISPADIQGVCGLVLTSLNSKQVNAIAATQKASNMQLMAKAGALGADLQDPQFQIKEEDGSVRPNPEALSNFIRNQEALNKERELKSTLDIVRPYGGSLNFKGNVTFPKNKGVSTSPYEKLITKYESDKLINTEQAFALRQLVVNGDIQTAEASLDAIKQKADQKAYNDSKAMIDTDKAKLEKKGTGPFGWGQKKYDEEMEKINARYKALDEQYPNISGASNQPSVGNNYSNYQRDKYGITEYSGMIERGNIDLMNRPVLNNKDGSHSTVRIMSFEDSKGRGVLVPSIINGKEVSPKEAWDHYLKTKEHMGIFKDEATALKYNTDLHDAMGWIGNGSTHKNESQYVTANRAAPTGSKLSIARNSYDTLKNKSNLTPDEKDELEIAIMWLKKNDPTYIKSKEKKDNKKKETRKVIPESDTSMSIGTGSQRKYSDNLKNFFFGESKDKKINPNNSL